MMRVEFIDNYAYTLISCRTILRKCIAGTAAPDDPMPGPPGAPTPEQT